jgi:hypothetical protein
MITGEKDYFVLRDNIQFYHEEEVVNKNWDVEEYVYPSDQ